MMFITEFLGWRDIQKNEELYTKQNIFAMNGILEVRPNLAFKITVFIHGIS